MNEQITSSKKITVGTILSWGFGVLFLLAGISNLTTNTVSGFIFIVLSAIILPPAVEFTSQKWNFHLSTGLKTVIIIVGLGVAGSLAEYSNDYETNSYNTSKPSTYEYESETTQTKGSVSQSNALAKAKIYLKSMPFSYKGLIQQLEYDQYSNVDATYGADNCDADWDEQATKKANVYLKTMAFSRGGLIDQLKYDGFTTSQAKHGANSVGL